MVVQPHVAASEMHLSLTHPAADMKTDNPLSLAAASQSFC